MKPYYEHAGITIYHGDSREVLSCLTTTVDIVLTDPPYSSGGAYRSDRNRSTSAKYQHSHETVRTYDEFSGDNRDQRSFERWCERWMADALRVTRPEGVIGCFIDWRNVACVIDAVQIAGWVYRGLVPWHKGSDQRPRKGWFRHNVEYLVFGSKGPLETGHTAPGICQDGALYVRVNGLEKEHQTQKPQGVIDAVLSVRPDWQIVMDPFMGSGTTLVSAKCMNRRAIGIEIEERYCEMAANRLSQETLPLEVA